MKDDQTEKFKSDLKDVFASAIELGRSAEGDQSLVNRTPSVSERGGWKEFLPEYEANDPVDLGSDDSTLYIRANHCICDRKYFDVRKGYVNVNFTHDHNRWRGDRARSHST